MTRSALLIPLTTAAIALNAISPVYASDTHSIDDTVKQVETTLGAKVGIAVLDTGSQRAWFHRADDRFPMASTSKALTCAALLDKGQSFMNKEALIKKADLDEYAPVTSGIVGKKVSAADLCSITMRTSDNTAVNKVLEILGGPQAVTAYLRKTGDNITRLDRNEPDLNEGTPGDVRDTTTPRAILETLNKLVLGTTLGSDERKQLTTWLESNEVGDPLLRAGVPSDWRVADRTGAGGNGTRGVIAVMWPPKHAPIIAAIYITQTKATMEERNAAIASIGKAIAAEVLE
ncbi:TPA: SCO family class A beta-lactamase [Klebsiella pneumoniae]